jgi:hypothetical protein
MRKKRVDCVGCVDDGLNSWATAESESDSEQKFSGAGEFAAGEQIVEGGGLVAPGVYARPPTGGGSASVDCGTQAGTPAHTREAHERKMGTQQRDKRQSERELAMQAGAEAGTGAGSSAP